MNQSVRYVFIDDDSINNKICSLTIKKTDTDADIRTFLNSREGFDHIVAECSKPDDNSLLIVFLDINMPLMNGWEFLDQFDQLSENIKSKVKIYILSSSVDKNDIDKARSNKYVTDYFLKPFSITTLGQIRQIKTTL